MSGVYKKGVMALAVAMVFGALTLSAEAQQVNTLRIQDGVVEINGRTVDPADIPESLDPKEVDLAFSFTGIDNPVVKIGGAYYLISGGTIREVDAGAYRELVAPDAEGFGDDLWYRDGLTDAMTRKQMEALNSQAAKMHEMSVQLQQRRNADIARMAEEMQREARVTAEMARELPKMQVVNYWDEVRQADQQLYQQLVREWEIEQQIQRLAASIRALSNRADREAPVQELRSKLNDVFQLKQENRRREIEQIERELHALKKRMADRERARQLIIERRLKELVGE